MANDHAGLFGPVAADNGVANPGQQKAQGARRTNLYPHDTVAAQYLNPYGDNGFDRVPGEALWKGVKKGSFKATFHSEFAAPDDDEWRLAVGMSRTAESLLAAIVKLESGDVGKLLKPDILAKAKSEIAFLKPALVELNFGKGSEAGGTASLSALKKMPVNDMTQHDESEVRAAALIVHKWASQETSPLRGIIAL